MILLDTDHLSLLKYHTSERSQKLRNRLEAAIHEVVGLTIITIEEQMRGWLAAIAKERKVQRQVSPYRELQKLFSFYGAFPILAFDESAAVIFDDLRSRKIRVGTMDLKIAAIALSVNGLLLTANQQDFKKVPNLRIANWMD